MKPLMVLVLIVVLVTVVALVALVIWLTKRFLRRAMHSDAAPDSTPVSAQSLKEMLLKLNGESNPFTVKAGQDTDLEVEWNIVDAHWIEALGKGWARKTYSAWIRLDEETKAVKYCEYLVESGVTFGGGGFTTQSGSSSGLELWGKRRGHRWGIREDFTIGEIYDYQFSPNDIKCVVRQIANDHGWAFDLVFTKRQASYSKKQAALAH